MFVIKCIRVRVEFGVKGIKIGVLGLKIVDTREGKHQEQGCCSGVSHSGENVVPGEIHSDSTPRFGCSGHPGSIRVVPNLFF